MDSSPVVILGAGPAGLTAAYELAKKGVRSAVLEETGTVGGLAQTAVYKGYRFDIGGHRFFTKVSVVEDLWHELLGEDMLERSRMSRIYYNGKFFSYPLKAFNALAGLGIFETLRCVGSYGWARFPRKPENDFATWISNRFGNRLFELFCFPASLKTTSPPGSRTASAIDCSSCSSRLTPRRSGASPAPRSRPNGPRNGSRAYRWPQPSRTR